MSLKCGSPGVRGEALCTASGHGGKRGCYALISPRHFEVWKELVRGKGDVHRNLKSGSASSRKQARAKAEAVIASHSSCQRLSR